MGPIEVYLVKKTIAVADAVEGMAIPGGDRQSSRAPTALKGTDLPAPWDPLRCTSSKRQIVVVIEVDQLRGPKRRDSPRLRPEPDYPAGTGITVPVSRNQI